MEKRDSPPSNNSDQNKQANATKREVEREIGRKLTKHEEEKFHRYISGQGYGYRELVDEGIGLFGGD